MEHEMIMMKFLSSDKTIETNKMEKSCYGLCFCLCFSFLPVLKWIVIMISAVREKIH